MTSQDHRHLLLRSILLHGSTPVVESFAFDHIFPDITISSWTMKHGLQMDIQTMIDFTREKPKRYKFLVFSQINDEHL